MERLTEDARRRLARDFSLPVPVFSDPYFMHYMELLEASYGSMTALKYLNDAVSQLGSESAFYKMRDNLVQEMKDDMLTSDAWKQFSLGDVTKSLHVRQDWCRDSLYLRGNEGKSYVSLDLREANFQSLKWLDKDLVLGFERFEELLGQYTDLQYLHKSKMFRQFLYGLKPLFPQRQRRAQQALMTKAFESSQRLGLSESNLVAANNDEFVFLDSDGSVFNRVNELASQFREDGVEFTVEKFDLDLVHAEKSFFAKKKSTGKLTLKKVEKQFVPEVVRHLRGEEPNPNDRFFLHEGRVSQYVGSLY